MIYLKLSRIALPTGLCDQLSGCHADAAGYVAWPCQPRIPVMLLLCNDAWFMKVHGRPVNRGLVAGRHPSSIYHVGDLDSYIHPRPRITFALLSHAL